MKITKTLLLALAPIALLTGCASEQCGQDVICCYFDQPPSAREQENRGIEELQEIQEQFEEYQREHLTKD